MSNRVKVGELSPGARFTTTLTGKEGEVLTIRDIKSTAVWVEWIGGRRSALHPEVIVQEIVP